MRGCAKRTPLAVAGAVLAMVMAVACSSSGNEVGSATAFCDAARAAKSAAAVQQELFSTRGLPGPDKVQPAVEDFAAKFAAMTAAAPPAIKADVDTINKAAQQLLVVTKANGFDVSTLSNRPEFQELTDTMTSPEYEDAQGRFGDYTETTCGITTTSGS